VTRKRPRLAARLRRLKLISLVTSSEMVENNRTGLASPRPMRTTKMMMMASSSKASCSESG